jgi:hypothetical protein
MAAITSLDRVGISILAPDIMKDLRLTAIQMGYVFSAFTLAYASWRFRPHGGRTASAAGAC